MNTKVAHVSSASYSTSIVNNNGNKGTLEEGISTSPQTVCRTDHQRGRKPRQETWNSRGKVWQFQSNRSASECTQPSSPSLITSSPLPARPAPSFPLRSGEEYREYRCTTEQYSRRRVLANLETRETSTVMQKHKDFQIDFFFRKWGNLYKYKLLVSSNYIYIYRYICELIKKGLSDSRA